MSALEIKRTVNNITVTLTVERYNGTTLTYASVGDKKLYVYNNDCYIKNMTYFLAPDFINFEETGIKQTEINSIFEEMKAELNKDSDAEFEEMAKERGWS